MGGVVVPQVEKFKYLGSIVKERGDIDEDISHRIRAGWQKWSVESILIGYRVLIITNLNDTYT